MLDHTPASTVPRGGLPQLPLSESRPSLRPPAASKAPPPLRPSKLSPWPYSTYVVVGQQWCHSQVTYHLHHGCALSRLRRGHACGTPPQFASASVLPSSSARPTACRCHGRICFNSLPRLFKRRAADHRCRLAGLAPSSVAVSLNHQRFSTVTASKLLAESSPPTPSRSVQSTSILTVLEDATYHGPHASGSSSQVSTDEDVSSLGVHDNRSCRIVQSFHTHN